MPILLFLARGSFISSPVPASSPVALTRPITLPLSSRLFPIFYFNHVFSYSEFTDCFVSVCVCRCVSEHVKGQPGMSFGPLTGLRFFSSHHNLQPGMRRYTGSGA